MKVFFRVWDSEISRFSCIFFNQKSERKKKQRESLASLNLEKEAATFLFMMTTTKENNFFPRQENEVKEMNKCDVISTMVEIYDENVGLFPGGFS